MSSKLDIQLHNTLTRTREAFVPISEDNIRVYACGPTVYDYAHIGNARPAIVFDLLFRLLREVYGASSVTYVRNITDVDDKIIARAAQDHPNMDLNEAISQVTKRTEAQYQSDMAALGCLEPTHQPRATENIQQMIDMIGELLVKSHAYQAQNANGLQEVLFDVNSMAAYGQLSNRKLEDQQAGARVAVEAHKKSAGDFVLWKEAAKGEPGWNSPFGFGRPGWHLECSAMSARYLGPHFDIHGGGLDLIFPHHENEIAQSCCANGNEKMANYWMHNGFLQLEGRKMSKSDGNFITVNELLESDKFGGKKWDGSVVRYAMLMTQYSEPIDFSTKRLEEASTRLAKLRRRLQDKDSGNFDAVLAPLADDLNTCEALIAMSNLSGSTLAKAMDFMGLAAQMAASGDVDEAHIKAQIQLRLEAFAQKDWAKADAIRDELKADGVQLKDAKDPQTGERVTTWEVL